MSINDYIREVRICYERFGAICEATTLYLIKNIVEDYDDFEFHYFKILCDDRRVLLCIEIAKDKKQKINPDLHGYIFTTRSMHEIERLYIKKNRKLTIEEILKIDY